MQTDKELIEALAKVLACSHRAATRLFTGEPDEATDDRMVKTDDEFLKRIEATGHRIESRVRARHTAEPIDQHLRDAAKTMGAEAAHDVLAERKRQVEVEDWTFQHDDEHTDGELASAAACYALSAAGRTSSICPPLSWPWAGGWWKPKDRRRDLVRAAALIIAEIERLDRLATRPRDEGGEHG